MSKYDTGPTEEAAQPGAGNKNAASSITAERESLLALDEDRILKFLLETDQPDWPSLKSHAGFTERWVVLFLRRTRPVPKQILLAIFRDRLLRKYYSVRMWLFRNKSTPLSICVNILPTIRRTDLFTSLKDPWLPNPLKVRIETHLLAMFPRLPLGEKIVMARHAPKGLIRHLRLLPRPQVAEALLDNYFFTFEDAMFMASFPKTTPEVLRALAHCPRWNQNPEIKNSLLRHPNTPQDVLARMVKGLSPFQLRRSLADARGSILSKRLIRGELANSAGVGKQDLPSPESRSLFS